MKTHKYVSGRSYGPRQTIENTEIFTSGENHGYKKGFRAGIWLMVKYIFIAAVMGVLLALILIDNGTNN